MGWGVGREVQEGRTYIYLRLIHIVVWQKPTQYYKAIMLQLKIIIICKPFYRKKNYVPRASPTPPYFFNQMGFASGKKSHLPMLETYETQILSLGREDSWEGNGNPLQYSCLENHMDSGAWQATVHGVTKSQTWLSTWVHFNQMLCGKYMRCPILLYWRYLES